VTFLSTFGKPDDDLAKVDSSFRMKSSSRKRITPDLHNRLIEAIVFKGD